MTEALEKESDIQELKKRALVLDAALHKLVDESNNKLALAEEEKDVEVV